MRTYYVYMLRCIDGTFYVGVTNDIERRYAEHCSGSHENSYTHSRRPLRLAYVGEFDRPEDAIAFEKRLKSWSHNKKRDFAEGRWAALQRRSGDNGGGPSTSSG
jgi:putative endonuclease